jgi:hypothetical protein
VAPKLDAFDERIGAVGMVAVDQLHHQPQQRGDYLFARENQNVTHSDRPRRVVNTRQLADLLVLWRIAGNP